MVTKHNLVWKVLSMCIKYEVDTNYGAFDIQRKVKMVTDSWLDGQIYKFVLVPMWI